MIQVLLVDDHKLFLEGLEAILLTVEDIDVVGVAENGQAALEQVTLLRPDVVLMDIQMPDMSGIEACQWLHTNYPEVYVIMLTMLEDSDSLLAAMRVGARSYILKGADKQEVVRTIRAVGKGDLLFGAEIAERVAVFFQTVAPIELQKEQEAVFPELTEREYEVLNLMAQGNSNAMIADKLNIASKTVSNHVSNIYNKLHVADRAQAVIKAREAGMGLASEED